jgi:predicted deacylase
MPQTECLVLEKEIQNKRIIHHVKGREKGPILVFFGGIHGNEPAGVLALEKTLKLLDPKEIKGEVIGIYGNLKALKQKRRFLNKDLNRIWTTSRVKELKTKALLSAEEEEQSELYDIIVEILRGNDQPIYFIDFHTTSSPTLPFITINDALINRDFSMVFPVPIVLGIEEYLEGPMLSYLNKEGYVSLGFEAGQHVDPCSVTNCEAFIYLSLVATGSAPMESFERYPIYYKTLRNQARGLREVFEVMYKYEIKPFEDFRMNPGFVSFQKVKKGDELAVSNEKIIQSPYSARLFMPLYQKEGEDGFFIIKSIPKFFLELSALLRRFKADSLLTWFPGISWQSKSEGVLRANLKVTRYLAKSIFHLFGYRSKQMDESHLLLYNRERVARTELYKDSSWLKHK